MVLPGGDQKHAAGVLRSQANNAGDPSSPLVRPTQAIRKKINRRETDLSAPNAMLGGSQDEGRGEGGGGEKEEPRQEGTTGTDPSWRSTKTAEKNETPPPSPEIPP